MENDTKPKVNRAIGMRIKEAIMKEDPKFLNDHLARADEYLPETEVSSGGYSFYIAGKYWVGKVVIRTLLDGFLTMEFGRFPKNAEGKNEWKVDHKALRTDSLGLIAILSLIDEECFKVAGGVAKPGKRFNFFKRTR
jgi:hypothetical protein